MTEASPSSEYHIVTQPTPTFYFIGVTTGKSAMMRLFPLWAEELGRPEVVIKGMDLKLHDEPFGLSPGGRTDQVRPALARRAGHDAQDRPAHSRAGYVRFP